MTKTTYEIVRTFNLQQRGELKDQVIEEYKKEFDRSETATYITDQMAESTTDQFVRKYISLLKEFAAVGKSTAVFTITITTTNLKTKKQVCKWDIEWNKGSVSGKKY